MNVVEYKSLRILAVENNALIQKALYNILKSYGSCDIASDGVEGLEKVKKSVVENNFYDLICLDIELPKLGGIQLLQKIRYMENYVNLEKKSVIIMITAIGDKKYVKQCHELGCNSYLMKPVSKDNLALVMKRQKLLVKIEKAVQNPLLP